MMEYPSYNPGMLQPVHGQGMMQPCHTPKHESQCKNSLHANETGPCLCSVPTYELHFSACEGS